MTVSSHRWISSKDDEWAYIVPLDENDEVKYNLRRASLFGASLELETRKNADVYKMFVAMKNYLVDKNDDPRVVEGFVKTRNLSEDQKRKLRSMANEMNVKPYTVITQLNNGDYDMVAHADNLEEARRTASQIRQNNTSASSVRDLLY